MIHACQLQWKSQVLMRHALDVKEDTFAGIQEFILTASLPLPHATMVLKMNPYQNWVNWVFENFMFFVNDHSASKPCVDTGLFLKSNRA